MELNVDDFKCFWITKRNFSLAIFLYIILHSDLTNDALQFDTLLLYEKLPLVLLFAFIPREFASFLVFRQFFAQQWKTFLQSSYLFVTFLGGDAQNFLRKSVRFFLTLGLKNLEIIMTKSNFWSRFIEGWAALSRDNAARVMLATV